MRSPDQKIALLRRVPFFRGCPDRDLVRLARQVEECEVTAGEVLVEQGQIGRESFIVIDGWAAVSRDGETIAAIGPGEFIGEMSMLDHGPRSATVVAKTSMQLLVLGPRTFQAVANEPIVGRQMAAGLAKRLRDVQGA